MLHHLRARNRAVFIDMTYDEGGNFQGFCHIQKTRGAFFDLAYRAGRGCNIIAAHGLNRIYDHKIRLCLHDQPANFVHITFCRQLDIVLSDLQPIGTQLDLALGFLARNIQNRMLGGHRTAKLQKHGRFSHARLAAQQNNASQNNAAAQHTIQLFDAG